jgi:ATP-dependent DNA helicase RecQ
VSDPLQILSQYWGFSAFRNLQKDIIDAVLDQKDTVALLPTGGGKSLCYQLPALCRDGLCLVISPLIALMKDQVDQLNKRGIKAYAIYTGLTHREIDIILDNCIYGQVKLLYVSPERLQTEIFVERVRKMNINLLAVDEAHCISQWGYDFRPSYLQIAAFRNENLPDTNTIALTATATGKVVDDISANLELNSPQTYRSSFARENLALAVRKVEDKDLKLLEILTNVPGTSCVYVRTRRRTRELTTLLLQNKISADYYHAGLSHDLRTKKQDLWLKGETRVIVATNAFGMGIDKNNVRSVIHYDLPDNLEAYYQEAGRAGRDGKKAYAVALYHEGDRELLNGNFENAHPSVDFIKRVYQALANYFKIAVGSNKLSFFDFDITDFCQNFNLHNSEAYYAIQKLEEEGFVELNESFYHPSKISINLSKEELYRFQIANASFDPIIKTILRLYGGEAFVNFVRISETQITRLLNTTSRIVKNQLEHLNNLKVITYDRMRDKPQLAFITHRYDAAKLPLNQERLNNRRKIKREKLDAILIYVTNKRLCRTAMILEYFGETVYEDCGHCDICLEKKRKSSKSDHERVEEMLHYELKKGPKLPEELTALFEDHEIPMVEEIIRDMNDRGLLKYDNLGRLVWRKD